MIAHWVAEHALLLNVIAYALGAISLIFGGKVLGRLPSLKRQGGFYSTVLVGMGAGLFVGGISYLLDTMTQLGPAHLLGLALPGRPNVIVVAAGLGVLFGMLPNLTVPGMTRGKFWGPIFEPDAGSRSQSLAIFGAILLSVTFLAYVYAVTWLDAPVAAGRYSGPPLLPIVILMGFITAFAIFSSIALELSIASIDAMKSWGYPPRTTWAYRRRTRVLLAVHVGCFASWIVVIALWIMDTNYINAVTYGIVWSDSDAAIFWATVLSSRFGLIFLRRAADRLSTRALTTIFTVPGAIAGVIGFVVNFPSILRILP